LTDSPPVVNANRALALAAFVLVAALRPAAQSSAALLPIEHHGVVVTLNRFGGAVLFGIAACFVSFRTLAVLSAAGCGLAFLAFATNLSTLAWLSLPLIAFSGALEVASYMLVLSSIESSGRYERAWWLLKDALVWVSLLFASSLSHVFLRGGGFVSCALLVALAVYQADATSPAPHVRRRASLLLFGAGCAVSLALSVLAFRINQSLLAGRGAGLFVLGSIIGELVLLIGVALSASVLPKPVSTRPLVGWILVGAAPLLPLATLVDVPALTAVSGSSNGSVAAASSLLLLAFLRPLPQRLQPLALASWLCIAPLIEGAVERCGDSFGPPAAPRIVLSLAAVTLVLAGGLALLRASRVEGEALSGPPSGR
jgi:hypothetical protein